MMKPNLLNHFFYSFTFIIFWFFIDELVKLNYNPNYEFTLLQEKQCPILVVCFKLNLKRNHCDFLPEKMEFNCKLEHQLECHTKGFSNLKRSHIKSLIKKCELEQRILKYDNKTIRAK